MAVQLESAARLAALRDKADAVTGESSATLAGAVDALIAGFGAGGGGTGGEAAELIFETSFSIPETLYNASKTTVATIETGIPQESFAIGRVYYLVINCVNDTDEDFSYPHFKERTMTICDTGSIFMQPGATSGNCFFYKTDGTLSNTYGTEYGLYANGAGTRMSSIKLTANCPSTLTVWGQVCSGDYELKLFRLNNDYFGVEGYGNE